MIFKKGHYLSDEYIPLKPTEFLKKCQNLTFDLNKN